MKILIVNKFLHPNGGSETYIFKLGKELLKEGNEVQYFGMEHEGRVVGNHVECYTRDMDFHTGKLKRLFYPLRIIYSSEARKKIRKVLDDFAPEVVHLNNFNFQLTPSIIYEIRKYGRQNHVNVKIIMTAHDGQFVCPNHLMRNPISGKRCTKCMKEGVGQCIRGKCIHGSRMKSILAVAENRFYYLLKTYKYIDKIICPSYFLKEKLEYYPVIREKLIVMHNFVDGFEMECIHEKKYDYVLYFGRYSEEKGIKTLLDVCQRLPQIPFVFVGSGPLKNLILNGKNIHERGFLTGKELENTIARARFCVIPSECYENCPFSVIEAQMCGTPVLGANLGGIPELIQEGKTGELFESGNKDELSDKISELWKNDEKIKEYSENCKKVHFDTVKEYCEKVMKVYEE